MDTQHTEDELEMDSMLHGLVVATMIGCTLWQALAPQVIPMLTALTVS